MRKIFENKIFWEIIGYLSLVMCVVGQVTVGYLYLVAEGIYLVANILASTRAIVLKLPVADIVKNIAFTGITIGLIVIYLVRM